MVAFLTLRAQLIHPARLIRLALLALFLLGPIHPVFAQTASPDRELMRERIKKLMEQRKAIMEKKRQEREALAKKAKETPEKAAGDGKKPEATTPAAIGAIAGKTTPAAAEPETAVAIQASRSFLTIQPPDQRVFAEEMFDTSVKVRNDMYLPFDQIELYLTYPPDLIELAAVSDAEIRDRLAGQPIFETEPTSGTIYYKASLNEPYHLRELSLLNLRWRALVPTLGARIFFRVSEGKKNTAMTFNGKDMLGEESKEADGMLGAEVAVRIENDEPGKPVYSDPMVVSKYGIRVRMNGEAPFTRVDEITTVTVSLDNPNSQYLDSIRLRLWFDPEVVEVVDWDFRNWIHSGINVYDGFAREDFPFSFHQVNTVDPYTGQIDYQMGMSRRFIPPSADLFKFKLRGLAPATENLVAIDILPRDSAGPSSAIFFSGRNVTDYETMLEQYDMFLNIPVRPPAQVEVFQSVSSTEK